LVVEAKIDRECKSKVAVIILVAVPPAIQREKLSALIGKNEGIASIAIRDDHVVAEWDVKVGHILCISEISLAVMIFNIEPLILDENKHTLYHQANWVALITVGLSSLVLRRGIRFVGRSICTIFLSTPGFWINAITSSDICTNCPLEVHGANQISTIRSWCPRTNDINKFHVH
jgi:hypothetical protein